MRQLNVDWMQTFLAKSWCARHFALQKNGCRYACLWVKNKQKQQRQQQQKNKSNFKSNTGETVRLYYERKTINNLKWWIYSSINSKNCKSFSTYNQLPNQSNVWSNKFLIGFTTLPEGMLRFWINPDMETNFNHLNRRWKKCIWNWKGHWIRQIYVLPVCPCPMSHIACAIQNDQSNITIIQIIASHKWQFEIWKSSQLHEKSKKNPNCHSKSPDIRK